MNPKAVRQLHCMHTHHAIINNTLFQVLGGSEGVAGPPLPVSFIIPEDLYVQVGAR